MGLSTSPPVPVPGATTESRTGPIAVSDVSLRDVPPWLVLIVACVFATLVTRHYDGLNGPEYWKWPWRNLETLSVARMLGALFPFAVAQWGFARRHWPRWSVLLLLMLTTFALEVVAAGARPSSGAHPVAEAVWDPIITSYFTDAASVTNVTGWIRSFPDLMPSFHFHSLNKPPFSILFYVPFIKLFGNNLRAALLGGFAVGALATLSVPAVYAMVRRLTSSADAALCSASFFALTPSLVLFMPEFDQLFPVLSCAVIAMWASALDSDHLMPAVVVGFLLAAMTLVSYNLLVLGVFLALQTLITLRSVGRVAQFNRIVRHADNCASYTCRRAERADRRPRIPLAGDLPDGRGNSGRIASPNLPSVSPNGAVRSD